MTCVIGIDKGTSATKAVVFDAGSGRVLGEASRPTRALHPRPGWHEEDMEAMFEGVVASIRGAVAQAGVAPGDVAAIGVSGHMGGVWALDAAGTPLGHAIAWPDSRAAGLLGEWEREGLVARIGQVSGNAPIPGVPLALLAWLKRHEPERYGAIRTLFFAKDYVNYRLTGRRATDESDLSFFPCDTRARALSPELLAVAGIDEAAGMLPEVLPTGAPVGPLTAEAAERLGLRAGTLVVSGSGDAVAAALGAGATAPGQAVTVIGTSFMNNLTTDRPLIEPVGVGFLFLMPGGAWQRLMANTGGGTLCLDWAAEMFCGGLLEAEGGRGPAFFAALEREVAAVPPLARGLIAHPYLNTSGMSAPRFDPAARASIYGLDTATTPAEIVRAVMEGVAFSMRQCYAALGAEVSEIRITGGGARSATWRAICAAVMDRPLRTIETEETGALGVAMLGAVAAEIHADLAAATRAMVQTGADEEPDPALVAAYARGAPLFDALGDALIPLWRHRARLLEGGA